MKVIVHGNEVFDDYDQYEEIIDQAEKYFNKKITCILTQGNNKGTDKLSEQYCLDRDYVKLVVQKAKWNDIKASGAKVKERINPFTKKKEKYNSAAGMQRDEQLINYADGIILCDPDARGANFILKMAQKNNIEVFIYYEDSINIETDKINF